MSTDIENRMKADQLRKMILEILRTYRLIPTAEQSDLSQKAQELKQQIDELHSRMGGIEFHKSRIDKGEWDGMEAEVAELQAEFNKSISQLMRVNAKISKLEERVQALETRIKANNFQSPELRELDFSRLASQEEWEKKARIIRERWGNV